VVTAAVAIDRRERSQAQQSTGGKHTGTSQIGCGENINGGNRTATQGEKSRITSERHIDIDNTMVLNQ